MNEELNITLDDLSEKQREIAEIVGIKAFIELTKHFGGGADFYIMKYSELKKISDERRMLEEFDGYNYKELAKKYDFCVKTVYNKIPPGLRLQKKRRPIDGQMEF